MDPIDKIDFDDPQINGSVEENIDRE